MSASINNSGGTSLRKSIVSGVLVVILIVPAKWVAEHFSLYHEVERACYGWLLGLLAPPYRRNELPIVIVDIRNLEYATKEIQGEKYSITPREELMAVIEAVMAQEPRVVGLDIDFSPHKIGFVDLGEPLRFRKLKELSEQRPVRKVPLFLGIHRSRTLPQEYWLGNPEFASLAANVENPDDNRKMFAWTNDGKGQRGLTMCRALANAFAPETSGTGGFASWFVRQVSETQTDDNRKAGEFLVDFSPLYALEDTRLATINPNVIKDQGWTLRDKAVLIGDGTLYAARDSIIVPLAGQSKPVPGIYLHATAAYTLIKSPIYELTGAARIMLDAVLALIVLACVTAVGINLRNSQFSFAQTRTTYVFIFAVTIVVVVLGVVFVNRTRILWSDFVFVIAGLWLHPVIELFLSPMKRFAKAILGAFRPLVSDEGK